jgi:ADP-ribose pyrophosphatase
MGADEQQADAAGGFRSLGAQTVYEGRLVSVRIERFCYSDGGESTREIVKHEGAVGVVAYDADYVWLVRQPREAVDEAALLEIPAGRLDVPGEQPLRAAQRELAEEVGCGARTWRAILSYYSSAGYTDEIIHLFAATELHEAHAETAENERIQVIRWPLSELDRAIAECRDAKTLIGLMWLARELPEARAVR